MLKYGADFLKAGGLWQFQVGGKEKQPLQGQAERK